jgi:hemolysin III
MSHDLLTRAPLAPRLASTRELAADGVVHALGIGLGLPAALAVVAVAAAGGTPRQLAPVAIYAVGLVAMFGCSAAYNLLRGHRWRDWLQRLDHAAIFAMIAGTYTPFTLRLERTWSTGLTTAIWTIAAVGIAAKLWRPRRIGSISVVLYLALGWIGLVALGPFMASLAPSTLLLLASGGAIYTAGVIFHLWHRLPYQNAIWHGFVLVAASVHYAAVLTTLGA